MRFHVSARLLCLLAALVLGIGPAAARTIAVGEERVVEGTITAVDVAYRTVVIDVDTAKGPLTVGVTLDAGVTPRSNGDRVALGALSVGQTAVLRYTRRDGRLVGLDLNVRR